MGLVLVVQGRFIVHEGPGIQSLVWHKKKKKKKDKLSSDRSNENQTNALTVDRFGNDIQHTKHCTDSDTAEVLAPPYAMLKNVGATLHKSQAFNWGTCSCHGKA